MGIIRQTIKALVHENNHKKISGDFVSLGKQSVNVSIGECEKLTNTKFSIKLGADKQTRHAKKDRKFKRITDHELISKAFKVNYFNLDISNYEGAKYIHDMNLKIPKKFENKFDFIFSGGCLDNIHNPSTALQNTSRMLKNNGRIMHWEAARGLVGHFHFFCPEWFYSYYAINNFTDCKTYLLTQRKFGKGRFDYVTDVFEWKPKFTRKKNFNYFKSSISFNGIHYILVIAEKNRNSTFDKIPTNLQYLDDSKSYDWRKMQKKFDKSKRKPITTKIRFKKIGLPYETDHFKYLGSNF